MAALAVVAPDAGAIQHATHLEQGLELASGNVVRTIRSTSPQAPGTHAHLFERFKGDVGGAWLAIWDEATDVPLRVFGTGIDAPNAVVDASAAAKHADALLLKHLDLFAPGMTAADFAPAANVLSEGQRVVSYFQLHKGIPVLGGQISFRFKNDRLFVIASEIIPHAHAKVPSTLVSHSVVEANARGWITADHGAATIAGPVEGPFVLPLVGKSSVVAHATVMRVRVAAHGAMAKFDVFVDAQTGAVVAREQTNKFATAHLQLDTPVRQPLNERFDFPASGAIVEFAGVPTETNEAGLLTIPDGGADGVVRLNGPQIRIFNDGGPDASPTFTFTPDGTVLWSDSNTETVDSQLTSFIHATRAKDYTRAFATDLAWLDQKITAVVNIDDACNAFYDGSGINFFRSNGMCENTGRIADVVYHEFGHGFHHNSIIPGSGAFEGALSEGVSDYLAATMTGDPGMGRGFFKSQAPLRHIDPEGGENKWPDDLRGEVHHDGLIIGGTLWDLRKLLVEKYGEAEGVALADSLFWQAMRNASDIPTMYPEILAADDDDGDLSNGTPNVCEIIEAFGAHGLRTLDVVTSDLSVEVPDQDGFDVKITVNGLYEQCGNDTIEDATVVWGLQRQATQSNVLTMKANGAGNEFTAKIPTQLAGEVVRYRVDVELGSGQDIAYPDNAADPMYQFFVGDVVPIYCTDFESDPLSQGWSHGLLEGNGASEGADDWMWGSPNGTATSGDPPAAFSGLYVFGNDLTPLENWNGHYQPNVRNYSDSPAIDASGYDNVRLQYRRWLNVEDGFFDQSTLYVNGQVAWSNYASLTEDASTHHTDREWRFHDIDLTDLRSDDGLIQVRFEIASDQGLQLGGWSIDDFCIVAYEGELPGAGCGNGMIDAGEECDDGNINSGDGCDAFCAIEDNTNTEDPTADAGGPLAVSNGCGCSVPAPHNDGRGLAVIALGAAVAIMRRRRS